MQHVNEAILTGVVTSNPQLRTTPKGNNVTNVNIKTPIYSKTSPRSIYTKIEFWGTLATHFSKHVEQGDVVLIVGHIDQESWTDQQNNQRKQHKVIARKYTIMQHANPNKRHEPHDADSTEEIEAEVVE